MIVELRLSSPSHRSHFGTEAETPSGTEAESEAGAGLEAKLAVGSEVDDKGLEGERALVLASSDAPHRIINRHKQQ